ncbi:beta-glucuronidase [Flavobacteriales bacterium]|nr:beta-glucuronidase [Flavobacteriales bacterium]
MKNKLTFKLLILTLLLSPISLLSQTPLIQNVYNRSTTSLNGDWHYIIDPYENGFYSYRGHSFDEEAELKGEPGTGAYFTNTIAKNKTERIEYNFSMQPTLEVPGSWTTQVEELKWYEGTIWYQRNFDYTPKDNSRVFLYFAAVNYESHVYVNGKKAGSHIGGFTPFNFDVTDLLVQGENFIVVKVDNTRKKEAVPTVNTDWWNHGGITRDVMLVELPENYLQDYKFELEDENSPSIKGFIKFAGRDKEQEVTVKIPELEIENIITTNKDGIAHFNLTPKKIKLWEPDNPHLYTVELITSDEKVSERIGFRTIQVNDSDILLNGKKVFLRGICMHEENPITGKRNYTHEDAELMLGWAKELNANFVRLAHYPHNEYVHKLADELGILIWEELPVYWTIDWTNQSTFENAKNQLLEAIFRNKNRASVIIWSIANETPVNENRNNFLKELISVTRTTDSTRLISAAMEVHLEFVENNRVKVIGDPLGEFVDIISFNQYHGWYGGNIDDFPNINWRLDYNKPVFVSEWGAGAKYGFHADKQTIWSEEYQAHLYTKTLEGIDRIPNLVGFSPWILSDFKSPRRPLTNIQDMWNRKGLIAEGGHKKKAFFVLQDYYKNKLNLGY